MSITYKPLQLSLRDLIASATRNPTVLVPDLQRTFVWKPSDVRFLVDSILHGWPFGTLLLWEIKESYYSEGEGIPSRPFWRDLVDRTCRENPPASKMAAPAVYQMVLDGQQRVQSLVIALGEDACGFKLFDHEWVEDLRQTRRERTTNWSRASLCVDLVRFEEELAARDKSVRRMETSAFLEWVVRAPEHQSDRSETNHTLPRAWHTPGRYIRLSRIWDLADGQLAESDYRELLRDFLPKQDVSDSVLEQIVPALAVFMCRVGDVRGTARADCLQIESLSVTRTWTRDDYNDAIVSIFTRLNTAGRTLTREEVTMAWLKVGWLASSQTSGRYAGDCLLEMHQLLADVDLVAESGPLDEVVRTLSFFWAVTDRAGALLSDRHLMRGDVIRPMAAAISQNWRLISESLRHSIGRVRERGLESRVTSFNALIVAWCWKYLGDSWLERQQIRVRPEHNYQSQVHDMFGVFLDRWQFSSQWSTVWSQNAVQNFQTFANILHMTSQALSGIANHDDAIMCLQGAIASLMAHRVEDEAIQYVQTHSVTARSRVSGYHSELWVWHRLEAKRAEFSQIGLRHRKTWRDLKPQVDHTVAHEFWQELVELQLATLPPESLEVADGDPAKGPPPFELRSQADAFINGLGNCALLRADFNGSKSKTPLAEFLADVQQFKTGAITLDQWCRTFAMDSLLAEPKGVPFGDLVAAIRTRDSRIRADLVDFVRGRLTRKDV